jgi:hypothetical protein
MFTLLQRLLGRVDVRLQGWLLVHIGAGASAVAARPISNEAFASAGNLYGDLMLSIRYAVGLSLLFGTASHSLAGPDAGFEGVWKCIGAAHRRGNSIVGKIKPVPAAIRGVVKLGLDSTHVYSFVPFNWIGQWKVEGHGVVLIPDDYRVDFEAFIRTYRRNSRTIHSAHVVKPVGSKQLGIKCVADDGKPAFILFEKTKER